MLLCTPIDGIWGVVAIERPDVGGKGGGIHVEVGDSSHMCAMPFLEVYSSTSVCFKCKCLYSGSELLCLRFHYF